MRIFIARCCECEDQHFIQECSASGCKNYVCEEHRKVCDGCDDAYCPEHAPKEVSIDVFLCENCARYAKKGEAA